LRRADSYCGALFDKLSSVIDTLISAICSSELDAQLAAASSKPHKKAAKKKPGNHWG
jgi:hypothetical protein